MARSFNGSSDAMTVATDLSAFNKLTVAFWLNWTTFANDDALAMEHSSNFGTNFGGWIIDPNAGAPASGNFYAAYSNAGNTIQSFTRPSAGTFHHYAVLFDGTVNAGAAGIPAIYVDAISQTLTDVQHNAVTTNFGNYNLYFMSRTASTLFGTGAMAEFAIWGGLLGASEVGALANGYSPALVRPASLVRYIPMVRANVDVKSPTAPTLTGTTVSPHPRIVMPRGHQVKRYRPVVVANIYVYMRPDADQSDGSWLNELGTNVNLYASVDETVASDTDYIQSSTTWGDKARIRLSDPGAGVAQPLDIRYRASGISGSATLTGRLYQGASTLISSWSHTVDTTPTNYTHTLNSTEFALISDFTDLFIEFEYNP